MRLLLARAYEKSGLNDLAAAQVLTVLRKVEKEQQKIVPFKRIKKECFQLLVNVTKDDPIELKRYEDELNALY